MVLVWGNDSGVFSANFFPAPPTPFLQQGIYAPPRTTTLFFWQSFLRKFVL
jgi:hypothetical protein